MSDDLIARAKAALEVATKGRRVQFHPAYCKEAEGTPFSEWDSSHETSVIRPDGTRYRGYATHRHAYDAALDDLTPDLTLALIETTAERDALRERVARLEAVSADLAHALRWCSGSSDFNEGGKAETGWKRVVIPALDARAALQEDTPND